MTTLKKARPVSVRGRFQGALYLAAFGLALFFSSPAGAENLPIILKPAEMRDFASPPPAVDIKVKPSFKEKAFPLSRAANLAEFEASIGRLSPAQAAFLEKNRFLLMPKDELFKFTAFDSSYDLDEMLANFDYLGVERTVYNPQTDAYLEYRQARFVGPDVFLQALHLYFSECLKALEGGRFRDDTIVLLSGLYERAKKLRAESRGPAAENWERFMSQMIVPLVLADNIGPPDESGYYPRFEDPGDQKDTLEQALKILETYRPDFSPPRFELIRAELTKVYRAEGLWPNLLGLAPAYASPQVDYSQFQPRGHYNLKAKSRSYFRAMVWLGQLGWSLTGEEGLTDAVNFALAMSFEPAEVPPATGSEDQHKAEGEESGPRIPAGPLAAWTELMELSSFFVGYPDQISYLEWLPFLAGESGGLKLTAGSGADEALIKKIAPRALALKPSIQPFADFQRGDGPAVLSVFPQRFTLPWLIADELTFGPGPRQDIPAMFSALWVPALLGSDYARSLMPRQMALNLAGLNNTDEEGRPLREEPPAGPVEPGEVKKAAAAMIRLMDGLKARLDKEPEAAWFSSIGAAWVGVLGTLTKEYGPGHPLYMRGRAFQAKQLETLLASYAELKHDTILYEKLNYAEMGGGEPDRPPHLKGFVEPNLDFWMAMIRLTDYIGDGFEFYDLFALDREEFGRLGFFKQILERCADIARRELAGEPLSDNDYLFIRDFGLGFMAHPVEPGGNVITDQQFQSAQIVDIQTANLNDGLRPGTIVYNALAGPYLMLVLVGNEDSPRLTMGLAFNHYEFVSPYSRRLTDEIWKKRVYGRHKSRDDYGEEERNWTGLKPAPRQSPAWEDLPPKNFWYDVLRP